MLKILYSFNKAGEEARYWDKEISNASNDFVQYIPFNHGNYVHPSKYLRAQDLEQLYYSKNIDLLNLYKNLMFKIKALDVDVILIDNANPYHPEFLKNLTQFKVLRSSDCALITYEREIPYLHAFDYVLFYTPGYSADLSMAEKFQYCKISADLLPLGSFSEICDSNLKGDDLFNEKRDIDIIYIGSLHPLKMPMLGKLKRKYGSRFCLRGLSNLKRNVYFNIMHAFPSWISPIEISHYKNYYKRAKIGINFHIRDWRQVGNYRLFDLPANGVMQISDGEDFLNKFFEIDKEIITYRNEDELFRSIEYYLNNEDERKKIALAGYNRVHTEYKIDIILAKAAIMINEQLKIKNFNIKNTGVSAF